MLIGLVAGEEGEEQESHSKVGTLLGPTNMQCTLSMSRKIQNKCLDKSTTFEGKAFCFGWCGVEKSSCRIIRRLSPHHKAIADWLEIVHFTPYTY